MKEKEIRNYSVISKGEYSYKQTNEFLLIERFLIIRKRSRRFLLLNFNNRRKETLTGLTLQIDQFDAHGNPLGAANKTLKDLDFKNGKFILKNSVELHRSCIDFRAKIVRAEYGNFAYCLGDNDVYVTYEKRKKKQPIDKESIQKEVGEAGVSVKRHKFGFPAAVGVLSAITLIGGAVASYVHLNKFKESESSFFLNNIEYAFVDEEDRSADALVNIVGYVGLGGDSIVIPNKVDGHPVYQVADAAFMYNDILEEVVIEGGVRIGINAFRGCTNLQKVEIKDNVTIDAYAFAECTALETFSANNLEEIGLGAFNYCDALSSVRLTGDKYSVLQLDSQVFANCFALTDIYIDQFVEYEMDGYYFVNTQMIENLYLKNYNYSQYETDTDKGISALLGANAKVKNITIGNMDDVPADFVGNCGSALETFTIKSFQGTKIGNGAFEGCPKLTSVSLSGGVSVVGNDAFSGCRKLSQVALSGVATIGENAFKETGITYFDASTVSSLGKSAFEHCNKLVEVEFSSATPITVIPERAFYSCTALETVVIPASVTSIEKEAFCDCGGITQVLFTQNGLLASIGENAFYGLSSLKNLDLPDSLSFVGSGAFACCTNLRFLYIPASLQSIADNALEYCYKLYEIENLSGVYVVAGYGLAENALRVYTAVDEERMSRRKVGEFEFAYAMDTWHLIEYTGLGGKVKLPESVEEQYYRVVPYMFVNDRKITELIVADGVARIGAYAFAGSDISSLQFTGSSALTIDTNALSENAFASVDFGNRAIETVRAEWFAGSETLKTVILSTQTLYIENGAFRECEKLASVTMQNGLLSVGDNAFSYCTKLTSVDFPASLLGIGESAFEGTSVQSVALGENLVSLGYRAFYGCENLESVVLPDSLTAVSMEAFGYCVKLSSVTLGNGLQTIQTGAFTSCVSLSSIRLPQTLTSIDFDAFGGCKTLHEVYNLSSINLQKNSFDNGAVAYNAIVIHTRSTANGLQTATVDGLVFKYTSGIYAIVDYTGNATTVTLDNKRVNGSTVSRYTIARFAFESDNSSIERVVINTAVADMYSQAFYDVYSLREVRVLSGASLNYQDAFTGCSIERLVLMPTTGTVTSDAFNYAWISAVYYEGNQDSWYANCTKWQSLSNGGVYFYDTCAHNGEWNYDANNNVQVPYKSYQYRVIKDATCRQQGQGEYYCNDCGYRQSEIIYEHGHSYSDGVCTRCGYIYNMHVNSYTQTQFKKVFTVSNATKTPFAMFTQSYDCITTTNKTANSTATLTFTAKSDIIISFAVDVFGAETSSLTVSCGTNKEQPICGGSRKSYNYTVRSGQTITFTYTQTEADTSGYAKISNMYITSVKEPD